MKPIIFLAMVSVLPLLAISQDFNYSFKEKYTIDSPLNLQVETLNGDIEVITNNEDYVEVYYSIKKGGKLLELDRDEIENQIKNQCDLITYERGQKLTLLVVPVKRHGFTKPEDAVDIHMSISVPRRTQTDLHSSDGSILIKGLTMEQRCITSDGDIRLIDLAGKVYAKSSDGNIYLTDVSGPVQTITSDGRVFELTKHQ